MLLERGGGAVVPGGVGVVLSAGGDMAAPSGDAGRLLAGAGRLPAGAGRLPAGRPNPALPRPRSSSWATPCSPSQSAPTSREALPRRPEAALPGWSLWRSSLPAGRAAASHARERAKRRQRARSITTSRSAPSGTRESRSRGGRRVDGVRARGLSTRAGRREGSQLQVAGRITAARSKSKQTRRQRVGVPARAGRARRGPARSMLSEIPGAHGASIARGWRLGQARAAPSPSRPITTLRPRHHVRSPPCALAMPWLAPRGGAGDNRGHECPCCYEPLDLRSAHPAH